jgi:nicotinate-nucleotide adenylyltransferase
MKIALFGGTFDPIHRGHISVARAAREQIGLDRILFIPANVPPHKANQPRVSFSDRYAMVVLATMAEKTFIPSLLEAPVEGAIPIAKKGPAGATTGTPNYSIDTVRRFKQSLKKSDRLFFLTGMDAFKDIAKWREPEALLKECEFIVANRPGYSLADVANALPESIRPSAAAIKPFAKQAPAGPLVLRGATIHLLPNVHQPASATFVRQAVAGKKSAGRFLDPAVAEYIRKMGLYK